MLSPELKEALLTLTVYDLGQPLFAGMPIHPSHPLYQMTMVRRHGDALREGGISSANELLVLSGHTGTHLDGLGHVSEEGRLHGGLDAHEVQRGGKGLKALGMETVAPVVTRGVLLDIAGLRGVPVLPPDAEVTPEALEAAAAAGGVEVRRGDAVLIRTGWIRYWDEPARYISLDQGTPGPNDDAARWLAARGVRVTGTDTLAYEAYHLAKNRLPVHRTLLVRNGIHIIEVLNLEALARDRIYEFVFVALPLKLAGATGSPIRPIALA